MQIQSGGVTLKDPEAFDHKFFKKSSREALAWDPQQRILLEVIYEALESAGYFGACNTSEPLDYGCYIGAVMNNYYDNLSCHPATAYATVGTSTMFPQWLREPLLRVDRSIFDYRHRLLLVPYCDQHGLSSHLVWRVLSRRCWWHQRDFESV
jgi:hypothetical protein